MSPARVVKVLRELDADIIALQESDSARVSLNNNDYVRYFAEQLSYYSYYGPAPVAGGAAGKGGGSHRLKG